MILSQLSLPFLLFVLRLHFLRVVRYLTRLVNALPPLSLYLQTLSFRRGHVSLLILFCFSKLLDLFHCSTLARRLHQYCHLLMGGGRRRWKLVKMPYYSTRVFSSRFKHAHAFCHCVCEKVCCARTTSLRLHCNANLIMSGTMSLLRHLHLHQLMIDCFETFFVQKG